MGLYNYYNSNYIFEVYNRACKLSDFDKLQALF